MNDVTGKCPIEFAHAEKDCLGDKVARSESKF
jgi:hypothetical protein